MSRIQVEPGMELQCYVDDFLWPWQKSMPVVMLHGFSRNATFWQRWIPYVAATHRIYRPEFRGFGKSDVPPEGFHFTQEMLMDDLVKVWDAMGIEKAHFVGESSGGVFGVAFALAHPERVASLVLCNTPTTLPMGIRSTYSLGEPDVAAAQRKFGIGEWCRQTLKYRLDIDKSSKELQQWYCDEMGKTPGYIGAAFHEVIETVDLGPRMKDVKCPILMLGGDKSEISAVQMKKVAAELPNVKTQLFAGFGHGINVIAPKECTDAALAFWKEIDGD